MHIIVTGGLGHIGSYLILDLVKNISKSKITVFFIFSPFVIPKYTKEY